MDATIISAASSTKNREKKRDPEMRQTEKGNQWYFGMKGHFRVESRTKLIHSVAATGANVHDSQVLPALLHGEETREWGDKAYTGQREAILAKAPYAQDFTLNKGIRHLGASLQRREAHQHRRCELRLGVREVHCGTRGPP